MYKRSRRIEELGTAVKQIHGVLRVGFEPGTYGFEVQHPNHSATLPSTREAACGSPLLRRC